MKNTKLPFRHKIKFIIPKLKSRSDYTGKTCLKHHSTLCKVCPLLKKAKAYKVQVIKQQLRHVHKDDPFSSENDLKSVHDDPFCHVDDLDKTALNTINSINKTTHHIKDIQSGSQVSTDPNILTRFYFSLCSHCKNCYCPRGTRKRRKRKHSRKNLASFKKIPSLLDLPFVIPPRYR